MPSCVGYYLFLKMISLPGTSSATPSQLLSKALTACSLSPSWLPIFCPLSVIFSLQKMWKCVQLKVYSITPVTQQWNSPPRRQPMLPVSCIFLHGHIMYKHAYVHTYIYQFLHTHIIFPLQEWQNSINTEVHLAFFTSYRRALSISRHHKFLHPFHCLSSIDF